MLVRTLQYCDYQDHTLEQLAGTDLHNLSAKLSKSASCRALAVLNGDILYVLAV